MPEFSPELLAYGFVWYAAFLFSTTCHEAAHALVAKLGGDDTAADALLEIIRRDREWNEGAARKRFLQLLEAQGLEDPWSGAQRRRLSAVLFT